MLEPRDYNNVIRLLLLPPYMDLHFFAKLSIDDIKRRQRLQSYIRTLCEAYRLCPWWNPLIKSSTKPRISFKLVLRRSSKRRIVPDNPFSPSSRISSTRLVKASIPIGIAMPNSESSPDLYLRRSGFYGKWWPLISLVHS